MSYRLLPTAGAVFGTTSIDGSGHWSEHAACVGADPDLFFAQADRVPVAQVREVGKMFCTPCVVKAECYADAKANGVKHGIRGGQDMNAERGIHVNAPPQERTERRAYLMQQMIELAAEGVSLYEATITLKVGANFLSRIAGDCARRDVFDALRENGRRSDVRRINIEEEGAA